jgi:uncharacterized protein YeaO (DUF488 family)
MRPVEELFPVGEREGESSAYAGRVIRVKRVYEPRAAEDGFRVLVDRLWPRGVSKERAAADLWLKDVGPSNELRTWYGHVPERWPEFRTRYLAELRSNDALETLRRVAATHGTVTLLFGARDTERNEAVVLAETLREGEGT